MSFPRCAAFAGGGVFVALLGVFAAPNDAAAQRAPGFASIGARGTVVMPEHARRGFGLVVDADLGYLWTPVLRVTMGYNNFSAEIDRRIAGVPVDGDLAVQGGRLGIQLDPLAGGKVTPYLMPYMTVQSVNAKTEQTDAKELIEGIYVGPGVAFGVGWTLDAEGRFAVTTEGRYAIVTNLDHWALDLGIRFAPRGWRTYEPARARRDPLLEAEQMRTARVAGTAVAEREEAARTAAAEQAALQRANQQISWLQLRVDSLEAALARSRATPAIGEEIVQELQRRVAVLDSAYAESRRLLQNVERRAADVEQRNANLQQRVQNTENRVIEAARRATQMEQQLGAMRQRFEELVAGTFPLRETERGLAVVLAENAFPTAQYRLAPAARGEIARIAALLRAYPDYPVRVEGHTDSTGGEVENQRLSELRAEAVRAALIAEGISPDRIIHFGYGAGQPIADNADAAGRALNRRVEIVLVGLERLSAQR